jgi:3',5'-cyclic AMP phosphodiesterase CpdA
MVDLETIILRFRDLVTARGQTIARHRVISDEYGYVWWGWWHKGGETIPDEAFRELATIASARGLTVYLVDSGQELLYRAVCTDIRWDNLHREIESPEVDKTPEYYNAQRYLAWFQLRNPIEEVDPPSVLNTLSYARVDAFFRDGASRYTPFYEKQVHSTGELRQQDRTIWFVRPFRQGDPTHEVSLLDPRAVTPTHFSTSFFESDSRNLLWVSDLHFSEEGHHAFPLEPDPQGQRFELGHQIEVNLKNNGVDSIAGVLISGDITWKAQRSEFELARSFVGRINSWVALRSDQLAVIPGNHDVRFSANPADKNAPITVAGPESREEYGRFYQDLFYLAPNEYMSCGRRFLLGKAIPVEIVCLNSSLLEQRREAFQGHGFIGQGQMDDASERMGWRTDSNATHAYRIVVLHHHILPTTYSMRAEVNYPYSVVLDAEALTRWVIKHRVSLILHGHMHQPFCAKVSRPLDVEKPGGGWYEFHVLGMGSSGVSGELGEVGKNTIGLLTFENGRLTVTVWSIHDVNPSAKLWAIELPMSVC